MGRKVLIIKTRDLFNLIPYFQGFRACGPEIIELLEKNSMWLDKDQAEKDPEYKQLIGYCAIISPEGKIFVYRRSTKDEEYEDKRLQGKWSIGIGGHIEPADSSGKSKIAASISRELGEELLTEEPIVDIRLMGMINDDTDDVGKVHIGLLLTAHASSSIITPKDPEIAFGELKTIAEAKKLFTTAGDQVENWSKIGIECL